MLSYGLLFLSSLTLTIVVETTVLIVVWNFLFRDKIKIKEIFYWGIIINLFSLPYLWFVFPLLIPFDYFILLGELLVMLIEGAILSKALGISFKKSLPLSILINVVSYLIGMLV